MGENKESPMFEVQIIVIEINLFKHLALDTGCFRLNVKSKAFLKIKQVVKFN